ncbi:MAG: MFS transporter [Actinomycetota bacterium]|nr:MFS transporter [Actinomycetota bacterium]
MFATGTVALLFLATPFLIVPISEHYGVSEGTVGLIALVQVGAFAAANFLLPRLLRPSGRILRYAAVALILLTLLSIVPQYFAVLLVLRALAGFAAGTMVWLAWTDAMKHAKTMPSIAAAGPLTALIASPLIALVAVHGDGAVYGVLAVATLPVATFIAPVTGKKRVRGVISASRSNRVLLVALLALTFFGSALSLNLTIVARDIHGISMFAASIGFSCNALGGLLGSRFPKWRAHPGWFLASIGVALFAIVFGPVAFFYIGMVWWGFAFWMGIPGVFKMLADRSVAPGERAGDAQGVMAIGRAFGPAMAGVFVDGGALYALAITAAVGSTAAGLGVVGVKEGRDRRIDSDPHASNLEDE